MSADFPYWLTDLNFVCQLIVSALSTVVSLTSAAVFRTTRPVSGTISRYAPPVDFANICETGREGAANQETDELDSSGEEEQDEGRDEMWKLQEHRTHKEDMSRVAEDSITGK